MNDFEIEKEHGHTEKTRGFLNYKVIKQVIKVFGVVIVLTL